MDVVLGALVLVACVAFAWTNGVHDASNAVATSLVTGALTMRVALATAAVLNIAGGLFGVVMAQTLRFGLVLPVVRPGLGVLLAGLLAAIAWNLLTWWRGMPSSSSHALVGGLVGAGLAAGVAVDAAELATSVVLPLLVSPLVGLAGAWLLTALLLRATAEAPHGPALRRFRMAQTVSGAALAFGHGLQDAQKTAVVMVAAGVAAGWAGADGDLATTARVVAAVALGAGTAFGGRRIIRTLGRRITAIDPLGGFAAQTVVAGALYTASGLLALPVSTTHVTVAAVTGAGTTRGLRAVRWDVVGRIALVGLATPVVTGAAAAALYGLATL